MNLLKMQESGRSMIEMVGVLAIAGLLTAGAFVLVQSGMAAQKRNRAVDEINTLAQTVRSMRGERDSSFWNILPGYGNSALPEKHTGATSTEYYNGNKMAMAILKSNGETPLGAGSYYALTSDGNGFVVWLIDIQSDDCETMALRTYSDGTATCSTISNKKVLKITYTK